MMRCPAAGRSKRDGMVLLVVVVIVMLLSLAAYQFMLSMQTEHMAVAINGDRIIGQQAAYSARDLLQYMLEQPRARRAELGGLADNPDYFAGNPAGLMEASISATSPEQPAFGLVAYALPAPSGVGADSFVSSPANPITTTVVDELAVAQGPTPGPPTRFGAQNESAKLHLLKLLEWDKRNPGTAQYSLMQLPGMDKETADAMLDWIDADDEPRLNGAESEFYLTLSRPLSPRNGLVPDVDELLFVKGVTSLRLFGTETELPPEDVLTTPQPGLVPDTSLRSEPMLPWRDFLTVYSAERNESYTGRRRVFLNGEDLQQLHSELLDFMPTEWANFIVFYRQFGRSKQGASKQIATDDSATINFTLKPEFKVRNLVDLIGASVTIPPEVEDEGEATMVVSPFRVFDTQVPLAEIFDLMTVVPNSRIVGRVNINEAPAEVLAALPGITSDAVEAIITSRDSASELAVRTHPIWLLVEGIIEPAMMRNLLPHLTCGGDVYRAEIWGNVDDRSPAIHFETILDSSSGVCRPVYHRELSASKDAIQFPVPATTLSPIRNDPGQTKTGPAHVR